MNQKQNKGITLIALVVTIILLLILVGISITMLTGQNGILNRAAESSKVTKEAQLDEQVKLSIMEALSYGKGKISDTQMLEKAIKNNVTEEYALTEISEGWGIQIGNKNYTIDKNGNLNIEKNQDGEKEEPIDNSGSLVLGLVDDCGTHSTIYLYGNSDKITSGNITITMPDNTIKTITPVNDNKNIVDSANYAIFDTTKNGIYTFTVTDGVTTTETNIRVSNIEKFTQIDKVKEATINNEKTAYSYKGAYVPEGFYVDTKTDTKTGLVITDKVDNEGYSIGNEWVWVPVNSTIENNDYYTTEQGILKGTENVIYTKYSKLYSFSNATTKDEYGIFKPREEPPTTAELSKPSKASGYREPALLTSSSKANETKDYNLINKRETKSKFTDAEGVEGVGNQYITDFENMVESVDKYHGFYIGRYEITEKEGKAEEKIGNPVENVQWYHLYNLCMDFDNSYITSGMMYGSLWDATMRMACKVRI